MSRDTNVLINEGNVVSNILAASASNLCVIRVSPRFEFNAQYIKDSMAGGDIMVNKVRIQDGHL